MVAPSAEAWFKRRILHAPNRIAEISACKMRHVAIRCDAMRCDAMRFDISMQVQSIIRLLQSNIRLFDS